MSEEEKPSTAGIAPSILSDGFDPVPEKLRETMESASERVRDLISQFPVRDIIPTTSSLSRVVLPKEPGESPLGDIDPLEDIQIP